MGTLLYWIAGFVCLGSMLWGLEIGDTTGKSLLGWAAFLAGASGAALFAGVGYAIKLLERIQPAESTPAAAREPLAAPKEPPRRGPKTYVID